MWRKKVTTTRNEYTPKQPSREEHRDEENHQNLSEWVRRKVGKVSIKLEKSAFQLVLYQFNTLFC